MRVVLLLAVLVLLPAVAAAPEPREIDTRLLTDTTASGDYGGGGTLPADGLDLLSLDAFEGTLPGSVTPAMVFRLGFSGSAEGPHRIDVHGTSSQGFTLAWRSDDGETFTSSDFAAVRGPFDIGEERVLEGYVAHETLDVSIGEDVTDLRVESHLEDEVQDAMPGSWFLAGQEVPLPPGEEEAEPATYTTSGPVSMFTVETGASLLPVGEDLSFVLNVTSTLDALDQELTIQVLAPDGVTTEAPPSLRLAAGETAPVEVGYSGVALGELRVLLTSDLGTGIQASLPLAGEGVIGTGGNVESGDLLAGDSFQYTFTAAGFFDYHCHPHPWMVGGVTIEEAANGTVPETHVVKVIEPDAADPDTWVFSPEQITIREGDTVVWVNEGSMVHDIRGSTGIGGDGHDHDHHDHDHGDEDAGKESPAPLLVVPLLAALWLRRR